LYIKSSGNLFKKRKPEKSETPLSNFYNKHKENKEKMMKLKALKEFSDFEKELFVSMAKQEREEFNNKRKNEPVLL